jgi:hypothetical protein
VYFVATQDRPVDIATVAESAARLSGTTVELLHAFALAEIQIKYQNRTGIQWLQTQYTGSIDPPPYSPRGPSDLGESSRPPLSLSLSLSQIRPPRRPTRHEAIRIWESHHVHLPLSPSLSLSLSQIRTTRRPTRHGAQIRTPRRPPTRHHVHLSLSLSPCLCLCISRMYLRLTICTAPFCVR